MIQESDGVVAGMPVVVASGVTVRKSSVRESTDNINPADNPKRLRAGWDLDQPWLHPDNPAIWTEGAF
mgnify:CR=1 FL=1